MMCSPPITPHPSTPFPATLINVIDLESLTTEDLKNAVVIKTEESSSLTEVCPPKNVQDSVNENLELELEQRENYQLSCIQRVF